MKYPYYTLDVFSENIFGGNQLAVFPDARGLTPDLMRKIAAEFNFSETVFVFPPRTPEGTRWVRIFTPATELPFAGHPTVGTGFLLASIGTVPPSGEVIIYLEEGVGLIPVRVVFEDGKPVYSELNAAKMPESLTVSLDIPELGAILSIEPTDILTGEYEPRSFSCGLPFLFIVVKDRDVLASIKLNLSLWQSLLSPSPVNSLYVFCFDTDSPNYLHARMFAPGLGVPEDPATGSAVTALSGFLSPFHPDDGDFSYTVSQGEDMGRPSILKLNFRKVNSSFTEVRVGGSSVLVCEGAMSIDV